MAESDQGKFDSKSFWTAKAAHYRTSARLHLQNWLMNTHCGYVVHPSIPADREGLHVADVGAGNGNWLIEASRKMPHSTRFDGFDITAAHFPAKAWLPSNVQLHVQDVYEDLSEQWWGKFDIVHVRAFSSIIKDNKVEPILDVMSKMLKPSGYVQWEENDPNTLMAVSPSQELESGVSQQLVGIINAAVESSGIRSEWMRDAATTFQERGLHFTWHDVSRPSPETMKPWTENFLLAYEDLVVLLPETPQPGQPLTKAKYMELFEQVIKETDQGVALNMEIVSMVLERR